MALKDILVHIDNSRRCQARLDAALALAAAHDAHLTGLYVLTLPRLPGYIRAEIPEAILCQQEAVIRDAADKAAAMFEQRAQLAGVTAEWRCAEGVSVPVIGLHGRYADLVIVGQRDRSGEEGADDLSMPDQLILSAGRPVLVIPFAGEFTRVGERILVAWDASRLATRAVNDALPLLKMAREVVVMAVNPRTNDEERGHGDIPSADICLHLARHGVNAVAQSVCAEDLSVGEILLSRAADLGIDLIVCGAYGHARWREIVLGGVTRHLLAQMTVPVLMSH